MEQQRMDEEEAPDAAAAEWVVRLQDPAAGETEWLTFDAWLQASPDHALAYDRALSLWIEIDRHAVPLRRRVSPPPAAPRRWPLAAGAALAAALALGWFMQSTGHRTPVNFFQTATGERSTASLADGSHIDLAGGTQLSVALAAAERYVKMDEGEAIFDVAPDAARPFIIAVGDRRIRVVGTEFDVRQRDGQVSVTVRRGVVEVSPLDPSQGQTVRLTAGDRVDHRIGSNSIQSSTVSADEIFAWRSGRLVYRDRPLSEVVADLNAQFPRPLSVADRKTADLRFSGVLVLDDEDSVVHRLTLIAPLWSQSTEKGIVVGAKDAAR